MDKQEFKFPDEKPEAKKEEELIIEVEDDTPEEDRNRSPMKEEPAEVTDEELAQYSDGVKKRIQHFSKGYHEERRAKEAAIREREEAIRAAQVLAEENKKLQANIGQNQQTMLEQAKVVVNRELEEAKRQYKEAYESGDSDKLVEAQEALTTAKIKADKVNNFKPALQKTETPVKNEPTKPTVDPKVSAWTTKNPWFGNNKRMTAFALAVHQELAESGVEVNSDEYYSKLDSELKSTFPSAFPDATPSEKPRPVVAPATRSTAPRKIVLTKTQENLAKRLGLTNEQYARAVAEELRKQNG
jgi:hypothetical protein